MRFLKFLVSKLFLKNLLFAIVTFVVLIWFVLFVLKIYTRHGQSNPVPDFRGLTISETHKLCKKHKLRFQIVDSVYLTNYTRGTIVEQNPIPGARVKKQRNVFLILNAFSKEYIKVPNVIGVSFRQAKYLIESNGLQINKLEYERNIADNYVLNQKFKGTKIFPGSEIPKYSSIDLVLGDGFGRKLTYVPDLTGQKAYDAKGKLIDSYCNLGTIVYDNTINTYSDSLNAFVWKQFPEFDENRQNKLGTYVDLWLTVDTDKIVVNDSLINETDTIQN